MPDSADNQEPDRSISDPRTPRRSTSRCSGNASQGASARRDKSVSEGSGTRWEEENFRASKPSEGMGSSRGPSHSHVAPEAPTRRSIMKYMTPSSRSTTQTSPSASAKRNKAAATKKKKPRSLLYKIIKRTFLTFIFSFLLVVFAGLLLFFITYIKLQTPVPGEFALAQKTSVYFAGGQEEIGQLSDVDRTIIDTSTLPKYVGDAIVASEDKSFYTNPGVDLKGIARATVNNILGRPRQGGSTLTQQYVENYYSTEGGTTYLGKFREIVMAVKINRTQEKQAILGNYMNTIYFGRGAYGIEAAANAYFNHSAKDLTLSESMLIAGIIPAPSAWDPAVDPDMANKRWERVRDFMVLNGAITQQEANDLKFPSVIEKKNADNAFTGTNGYLLEQSIDELISTGQFTRDRIQNGGLRITTTINSGKQAQAISAAESVKNINGWNPKEMHVALSAVDPGTGAIIAEYPGSDYQSRQQNAVTHDIAPMGSTMKPFALLANAERGGNVGEVFDGNSPKSYEGLARPVQNYGNQSWGRISLLTATRFSANTPFVSLNQKIGPESTKSAAIKAGLPADTYGLDGTLLNVLGFAAPHNIDMAGAYATIASGGIKHTPHIVEKVEDSSGTVIYTAPTLGERVFNENHVASIMPALKAVTARGGTGEKTLALGRPVAAKTGTAEDQMSAQFAGMVPQMVTVVSMYQTSEDGSKQLPLTNIGGVNYFTGEVWPQDVWVKFMKGATADLEPKDFPKPTQPAPPVGNPTPRTIRSTPTVEGTGDEDEDVSENTDEVVRVE